MRSTSAALLKKKCWPKLPKLSNSFSRSWKICTVIFHHNLIRTEKNNTFMNTSIIMFHLGQYVLKSKSFWEYSRNSDTPHNQNIFCTKNRKKTEKKKTIYLPFPLILNRNNSNGNIFKFTMNMNYENKYPLFLFVFFLSHSNSWLPVITNQYDLRCKKVCAIYLLGLIGLNFDWFRFLVEFNGG